MADTQLHETDTDNQGTLESSVDEADASATAEATDDADRSIDMEQVEAVLNATADKKSLTPQMQRMMRRQEENTKRVEETIKGTKANPRWFVPLFCALMILGLIWVVVYYLVGNMPIPGIGAWNLAIGFGIMLVGFLMTMGWR